MKPCIVIVGLDQIFLDEVVQGLAGENKPNDNNLIEFTIDTKYYTADVNICPVNKKLLVEETVANSAEVLILLIDPSEINSRTKLDAWLPFLSVLSECETKLLVVRNLEALTNTISKMDVKHWCTEHEYELLELDKTTASETDDEEDEDNHLCQDLYGIPRLLETLHIHQWSNMNLKDRREINRNLAKQLKAKLNLDEINDQDRSEEKQHEQNEQFDSSLTTNNHHVTDAFGMENIFEQMQKYKEEASRLTGDARKEFAEKVILSLWKDIGDEDDDDDDNGDQTNKKDDHENKA